MLAYDVFTSGRFQATEVHEALGNIEYIPGTLAEMGIFEPEPIRTTNVLLVKEEESLQIIDPTERGSQMTFPDRDYKTQVSLPTFGIRQQDRINAGELQNIISPNLAFDVALDNATDEVDRRQRKLIRQLELTREYHKLAALDGYVLKANGDILIDVFDVMEIARPSTLTIALTTLADGNLREFLMTNIILPMQRIANNSWVNGRTYVAAQMGDAAWGKLMKNPEVRETYLGYAAAADLRNDKTWDQFSFGGITWMHFRGTNDNSTIALGANEIRFFPVGGVDLFKEYRAPGEDMNHINQYGDEFYSIVSPDNRINMMMFVDIYLMSYFINICIKPGVLLKGTAT